MVCEAAPQGPSRPPGRLRSVVSQGSSGAGQGAGCGPGGRPTKRFWTMVCWYSLAACLSLVAAPPDERALFDKARTLEQSGDWAGAEAVYRSLLKQNPGSAEALGNLGVVLAQQAKYDAAAEAYRRALRLRPSLAALHLNLGLAYYKAEQREPAIEQFRNYLQEDPTHRQARQLLAPALLETDHTQEAARIFESLQPSDDFAIRLGLATAYVRLHRAAEAQRLLEPWLGREDSPEALVVLGQAFLADNS